MYIIIVGAGEVGSYLTKILVEEQHDVAVIESDEKLAREIESNFDALVVVGSGVSGDTLRQAGIDKADLVLAVTRTDEVNLIACMVASKFGKSPATVARVREAAYLTQGSLSAKELGLSLLASPEKAVADEVVRLLGYQGSGDVQTLADGRLVLLELPLSADSPLVHETLAEAREVFPEQSLVAAIHGPHGLRIPDGNSRMTADERAYILTTPENVTDFWILSGKPWHHVKHTLIIGCGTIGLRLAKQLEQQKMYPTIIEVDPERATYVSRQLSKSIVLEGDATDPELLREQLEERADAVVVLLEDDEKALLVGLFCKHLGAKKVIVRSDKPAYHPIAHKLGIDATLTPRQAIADQILRFVRRGRVTSAHMLGDHEGEIIQMLVPENPKNRELIEKPLMELSFPDGALIGAVIRNGTVMIGSGGTRLQPHDHVLVVSPTACLHDVENLFA